MPGTAPSEKRGKALRPRVGKSRLAEFFDADILAAKGFDDNDGFTRALCYFDAVQREQGIRGCVGEIGVAGGALFVRLALCCRNDEFAVAVDIFDQPELNWDPEGGTASLAQLKHIISDVIGSDIQVRYIEGDSFFLNSATIRLATGGQGFRLFSIDGAHSVHHTVNDLRLAGEILEAGGIAMLDDIQNWGWPGVITGFARYMLLGDHQRLVPFFLYGNKLLLTTPSHQQLYLDKTVELGAHYGRSREAGNCRISEFFGFRVMGW